MNTAKKVYNFHYHSSLAIKLSVQHLSSTL